MLYVIFGSDYAKAAHYQRSLLAALKKKRPEAEHVVIELSESVLPELMALAGTQGLFERKVIVEIKDAIEASAREKLIKEAKVLNESENVFVWRTGALSNAEKKKLGSKVELSEYAEVGERADKDFSAFSLAEALSSRNREQLWLRYQEAIMREYAEEELYGIMFWQLKSLILAHTHESAEAADMKPYPWQKAKRAASNFSLKELTLLTESLCEAYHEARLQGRELELALEHWILSEFAKMKA